MRCILWWLAFGSLVWGGFLVSNDVGAASRWDVPSPDGRLRVTLQLEATHPTTGPGRLTYAIEHGEGASTCQVLHPSPLGISREDQSFSEDLTFIEVGEPDKIDASYRLVHGKQRDCRIRARQQTFTFANAAGARVQLVFHVANDGVAFRYVFPENDTAERRVISEATGFQLPAGSRAWIQPYQSPSMWTPAYEDYYADGIEAGTAAPTTAGWCLPALFHVAAGDRWVLLAEAAVDETYCGCRLEQQAPQARYCIRFPEPEDGNGTGQVCPASRLPWKTPWRVVMVSDNLATIVGSTLITDLNPPSRVQDTSWIKPGRVAWSWWSDHDSPRNYASQCEFVDLAAEMGWEYVLVDANWTLMDGGNVRELADYAGKRGVGLLLWYNSGGPHNSVTEKPRGCLADSHIRQFEYKLLNQWGIQGIKVDFFHSDKQNLMQLYLDILKDAAEAKIMINFHGCTVPRGWSRTYPHLMSMEAVKGAECYTFASEYPEKAPWHNTILVFTRNVVGPMDYTPVAFTNDRFPHLTTNGHELALSVVFESAWLHFADRVSAYRNAPEPVRTWLKAIPVAWDETRLLGGHPGQWAVVARRQGDRWYVGGINGRNQAQPVSLKLDFLPDGEHAASWIGDAEDAAGFDCRTIKLTNQQPLEFRLPPRGGFVLAVPALRR